MSSTSARVSSGLGETSPRFEWPANFRFAERAIGRHTTIDGVTYKVAECREERERAFRMIHDAYTHAGLMPSNFAGMRVTPYHLLPTTAVFLAVKDDEILCTLSLIGDGELGVPMESIYPNEIAALRDKGDYFGELSCLADRRQQSVQVLTVLTNLNGLVRQYAQYHDMDHLLIAVHPKHERVYRRFFGFRQFGCLKSYPSVGDRPAIAAIHDFARTEVERYPMYDQIHATTYSTWELLARPMSESERDYFRPVADLCGGYLPMAAA